MIRSIHLAAFKCFIDKSFPIGPLTVLSGINGTGKSSLLQSLLLLRQSFEQELLKKRGLALNGSLVTLGTAQDILCRQADTDTIKISLADNDSILTWSFCYDPLADVLAIAEADASDEQIRKCSLFGDAFQYLCAERIGPRAAFAMADYFVRQEHQLGSRGEFAAHYLAVYGSKLITLDKVLHPDAASNSLKDQTEAWLGVISPGVRIEVTPHPAMDVVNLQYRFNEGRLISDPYRTTNVGFGITYALPIIAATIGCEAGGLLIVENPEAHLHPQGQVRLAELLCRAVKDGIQVILETHSDHILNGIRLAVHNDLLKPEDVQIHFFVRESNEEGIKYSVRSPTVTSTGRLSDWPQGFFDEWDKSLERLMSPKK